MNLPPFLIPQPNGCLLRVKVQPRAARNEIGEVLAGELKIKVTAPPVDAAANQALIELLADTLDCSRGSVQITRGKTSRHKTISVSGKAAEEVAKILSR